MFDRAGQSGVVGWGAVCDRVAASKVRELFPPDTRARKVWSFNSS